MHANPTGGSVTHGNATIDRNGNVLTINQGTDRLIMGWQTFSIGQGETTRFVQPSSSSMALNRVNGGTRSMIEGRLEANGGVILINPAGITVTKSGVVNVNTFIGSTHDITDDGFLKGGALNFKGTSDASVENLGTIHAETGDIALIARTVRNEGTISARKGVVGLAAGDEVLYQPNAEERLLVKSQTASASSIHHSGSIQAAAAEIKAAGNPYAVAINLDGIVEARGNAARKIKPRVIVHAAQGDIKVGSKSVISAGYENGGGLVKIQAATGNLQLDGKVETSSSMDNGGKGGEIQILGNTITLSGTALLDASGATGGGKIFVGGDYQGGANPTNHYASGPLQNASTLRIDKGAVMNADATVQGDGGVVINWADGTTISLGSVSVRGGPLGGNGGFVEVSGKRNLGFDGTVNVGAVKGTPGTVLFDPAQIQITSAMDLSAYNLISTGSNQIPYGDYSDGEVWTLSQSFFTNFTSGTISLQAYNISLEDPKGNKRANIVLNPNVNLVLESKAGDRPPKIFLPSGTETDGNRTWGDSSRSSITASGTGYVKLDASQGSQLVIHGDITTAAGDIILISQNGVDLKGASLKSTDGGLIMITSSTGNIVLNGSQIEGTSGAVQITAPNSISIDNSSITTASGNITLSSSNSGTGYSQLGVFNSSISSTAGGSVSLTSSGGSGSSLSLGNSTITTASGNITLSSSNSGTNGYSYIYAFNSTIQSTNGGSVSLTSSGGSGYVALENSTITATGSGEITLSSLFSGSGSFNLLYLVNSEIQSASGAINLIKQGGTNYASLSDVLNNWNQTLFIAGSSITSGSGAITVSSGNHILIDPVASTNGTYWPTSAIASVISSATGTVSMTALAINGIYRGTNAIANSTPTPTPAPSATPWPTPAPTPIVEATPSPTPAPAILVTPATIVAEPTVQTAVQSLTIRNTTTTTTSAGGSFGSAESGSEGSGSGGESASAGETASSGESSSSESGGETASSESSSESGSSSETSTASTDSGSGSGATTASADSSSSSGSTSTANSSSSSSSGGSATSSSGGSSQGAKTQAAAISRMNNPVGGATVGGAEFQRLNPFSDAGAMHEEVAASSASAGGSTQASTGRAAAVSVKSPEMTELAPMNDLNVLFMMF
ncbi:MAG: filamentous hemagglutinin N-terminal domain-containing protein [Chthoniobacterales bacterium]